MQFFVCKDKLALVSTSYCDECKLCKARYKNSTLYSLKEYSENKHLEELEKLISDNFIPRRNNSDGLHALAMKALSEGEYHD